jgi:hypothetical protein
MKNISLSTSGKSLASLPHPRPTRGAFRDRHDALGWGCDGRFGVRRIFAPDENVEAYGEVVWSWRRDAGAKLVGFFRK